MELKHVVRSLGGLVLSESNPRIIRDKRFEVLKESIKTDPDFLAARPIIVSMATGREGTVIAGNMRVRACLALGRTESPCVEVYGLSHEEEQRWALKDNLHQGEFDWDKLANEFDLDFLEAVGFDDKELDKILGKQDHSEDDEFDAEKALEDIKDLIVQKGDIWQLGRHRLMCGDSTKNEDVERLMDGKKADICFTSPPYNAGKTVEIGGKDNKYEEYQDNVSSDQWKELVSNTLIQSQQVSRYQFFNIQQLAGNKQAFIEFWYEFRDFFVDVAVWEKGTGTPALPKNVMNCAFEFVLIFSSEKNPKRVINTGDFHGSVNNVFHGTSQRNNEYSKIHSATFPIGLPSYFIQNFVPFGGSVLDIFAGTGTTLIACENLGRSCFCMDLDQKYCDVIIKRWEEKTGEKAVKLA